MKKILTGAIVGTLVLTMLPFSAFAEESAVENETNQQTEVAEEQTIQTDETNEVSDELLSDEEALNEEVSEETEEIKVQAEASELENLAEATTAPKLEKTQNVANGIEITFDGVEGAQGYNVYRKAGDETTFTKITSSPVLDTYYTDENVVTGTSYCYTVSAVLTTGESAYDEKGISTVYVKSSQITDIEFDDGSVALTWEKVDNATGYYVYTRLSGKTSFDSPKVINSADVTTYKFSGTKSGTYEFVVEAFVKSGSNVYGSFWDESYIKTSDYLAAPKFSVVVRATGNKITITKDSLAKSYRIYRKVNNSGWKCIAETANTTYADKDTKSGKVYTYTVQSVNKSGAKSCLNKNTITRKWLKPVVIKKISADGDGVTLKWTKISGAVKYFVYRKTKGQNYTRVAATKGTKYTDKKVSSKTTYYYIVKAVGKADGKNYISANNKNSVKKIKTKKITKGSMINKAQNYSSPSNYLILIDCNSNRMGVFTGSKGNWKLKYFWKCSTGASKTKTVKGVYSITWNRGYVFGDGYSCYYYSGFYGGYLIHSILYYQNTFKPMDPSLGVNVSHGCVRLTLDNAKWIYYNVPVGTTVVTY